MLFYKATEKTELVARAGPDVEVIRVEYDSRRAGPGCIFVAMRGASADGNRFIDAAIAAGAVAVITDDAERFATLRDKHAELAIGLTEHGRRTLALVAANGLGHPERRLTLTGVTGTNGKTTTTHVLEAMLTAAGRKTVLVGTIAYRVAGREMPSVHTTPEASDLLELLAAGVGAGASEAVMEVSSHALEQGRVWGIPFEVAVFTNLTRDHLDFHETMENYFAAKKKLFLPDQDGVGPKYSIVNVEDEAGRELLRELDAVGGAGEVWTYGLDQGDFHADALEMSVEGTEFLMETPVGSVRVGSRLVGRVNVMNTLAAAAAAVARGLTLEQVAAGLAAMGSVPGRFELVEAGQAFGVVVDYAHTDDALRNLTAMARELVKGGRVITLFGCGGDRDRTKRPLMARAAAEGSDFVVLTSDNPRSEDPVAILKDAAEGFADHATEFVVIPDRAVAIAEAIGRARKGDIVLIAGKGHEKTQTTRDGVVPFDDVAEARAAIERLNARTAVK
jgi:UDP-N-acetylmuramoyl-L-alanyl-D-glutamate--2,6-diaminopimelate ligase